MNHTLKELSQSNMIYSGIYKINFPNNKCYIGQAQNIEARQQATLREAAANKSYNNPGAFDD